jgi:maltooligosyltrehalose trehalohydrolase
MIGTQRALWGPRFVHPAGVEFRLWAPAASSVRLVICEKNERAIDMEALEGGWRRCFDPLARAGTRYLFEIDGNHRVPDPASRYQPDGVHAASEIVDPYAFAWPQDAGVRPSAAELVFYELHVGAFTRDGTYAAAAQRLGDLAALGVTAIELMPVAETAGKRSWGYDGVLLYAPAHTYGRPDELRRFIAAAHDLGIAVLLDVVYNHFGPEGNYLHLYAPQYFTGRHTTPWGAAIDYSSTGNDPVRAYAIENACYWLNEFRFDGLRLDATDTIYDEREPSLLVELAERVRASVPHPVHLVLENDENRIDLLRSAYDAQWNDDAHHALHAALTGEHDGYYQDYAHAPAALLGRALTSGYAYQGEASAFRGGRPRGSPSISHPLTAFVDFLQNHDQVGNRAFGERIGKLASPRAVHAAVAVLLLAPSPPLLFMGEEWGASTPFLYFCDFEPELAALVREGRRREFARFAQFADERARSIIPDPGALSTFERSKLRWSERREGDHERWLCTYETLLRLRRSEIVPRIAGVDGTRAAYDVHGERGLSATWRLNGPVLSLDANLGEFEQSGFAESAGGRTLYATHGDRFERGIAPPWSVRWSMR